MSRTAPKLLDWPRRRANLPSSSSQTKLMGYFRFFVFVFSSRFFLLLSPSSVSAANRKPKQATSSPEEVKRHKLDRPGQRDGEGVRGAGDAGVAWREGFREGGREASEELVEKARGEKNSKHRR
jgi:hypothetical protein